MEGEKDHWNEPSTSKTSQYYRNEDEDGQSISSECSLRNQVPSTNVILADKKIFKKDPPILQARQDEANVAIHALLTQLPTYFMESDMKFTSSEPEDEEKHPKNDNSPVSTSQEAGKSSEGLNEAEAKGHAAAGYPENKWPSPSKALEKHRDSSSDERAKRALAKSLTEHASDKSQSFQSIPSTAKDTKKKPPSPEKGGSYSTSDQGDAKGGARSSTGSIKKDVSPPLGYITNRSGSSSPPGSKPKSQRSKVPKVIPIPLQDPKSQDTSLTGSVEIEDPSLLSIQIGRPSEQDPEIKSQPLNDPEHTLTDTSLSGSVEIENPSLLLSLQPGPSSSQKPEIKSQPFPDEEPRPVDEATSTGSIEEADPKLPQSIQPGPSSAEVEPKKIPDKEQRLLDEATSTSPIEKVNQKLPQSIQPGPSSAKEAEVKLKNIPDEEQRPVDEATSTGPIEKADPRLPQSIQPGPSSAEKAEVEPKNIPDEEQRHVDEATSTGPIEKADPKLPQSIQPGPSSAEVEPKKYIPDEEQRQVDEATSTSSGKVEDPKLPQSIQPGPSPAQPEVQAQKIPDQEQGNVEVTFSTGPAFTSEQSLPQSIQPGPSYAEVEAQKLRDTKKEMYEFMNTIYNPSPFIQKQKLEYEKSKLNEYNDKIAMKIMEKMILSSMNTLTTAPPSLPPGAPLDSQKLEQLLEKVNELEHRLKLIDREKRKSEREKMHLLEQVSELERRALEMKKIKLMKQIVSTDEPSEKDIKLLTQLKELLVYEDESSKELRDLERQNRVMERLLAKTESTLLKSPWFHCQDLKNPAAVAAQLAVPKGNEDHHHHHRTIRFKPVGTVVYFNSKDSPTKVPHWNSDRAEQLTINAGDEPNWEDSCDLDEEQMEAKMEELRKKKEEEKLVKVKTPLEEEEQEVEGSKITINSEGSSDSIKTVK